MDLEPFQRINPCGHAGLAVTSIARRLAAAPDMEAIGAALVDQVVARLQS